MSVGQDDRSSHLFKITCKCRRRFFIAVMSDGPGFVALGRTAEEALEDMSRQIDGWERELVRKRLGGGEIPDFLPPDF